jgi:hypothetical protein
MGGLPTVNAFWVGPRLGRMHAACLQSFVRQGHRVVLHTYDPPEDAPYGVEIADASILLDRSKIIRHRKTGSLALASDLFRYELLAAEAGIYVDCDCYCVRPVPDEDFLFGWEDDKTIAIGVLKTPPDSHLLSALRAIGTTRGFIPPWEKPRRKFVYRLRAALGFPVPLPKMRWGTLGPVAFTYYTREFGLSGKTKPIDEYYPVSFHHTNLLMDPALRIEDIITPRTKVIHLWNEKLRKIEGEPPPESPLAKIIGSLES